MASPDQPHAHRSADTPRAASVDATTPDESSLELSTRRTGMSFQRTRLSADRTLMSVMRTALSLIGFGFTIFQFFRYLRDSAGTPLRTQAPRNFGATLVALGIGMLLLGIWQHVEFMRSLRRQRAALVRAGLVHDDEPFPYSMTLVLATLLLLVGFVAIVSMLARVQPFH